MIRRRTCDRGSVLILMPALVLVLLILGAIAVDSATVYLAHRQLQDFAATAADQAAVQALDKAAFYGSGSGGRLAVDATVAAALVQQLATAYHGGGVTITGVTTASAEGGEGITVTVTGTVHEIFGAAVGGQRTVTLRATSTASLAEVRVDGDSS